MPHVRFTCDVFVDGISHISSAHSPPRIHHLDILWHFHCSSQTNNHQNQFRILRRHKKSCYDTQFVTPKAFRSIWHNKMVSVWKRGPAINQKDKCSLIMRNFTGGMRVWRMMMMMMMMLKWASLQSLSGAFGSPELETALPSSIATRGSVFTILWKVPWLWALLQLPVGV